MLLLGQGIPPAEPAQAGEGTAVMTYQRVGPLSCLLLLALALRPVEAQKTAAGGSEERRKDALLVYGEGFAFSVKEPRGWRGDIEAARKYGVNIVFFPEAAESRAADVTIRLRVSEKVDENTAADLEADRDAYRRQYPQVEFGELRIRHPQYGTFPGLFFQSGAFYEYVSYLNPGPKHKIILSVAMSKAKSAATESELEAYETVLGSVAVVSDSLDVIQGSGSTAGADSSVDKALATARENVEKPGGEEYDAAVGKAFAGKHANTMVRCTESATETDLATFDLVMRIASDGTVEQALVRPETKVAVCLRESVRGDTYPTPPAPGYWVNVHMTIKE